MHVDLRSPLPRVPKMANMHSQLDSSCLASFQICDVDIHKAMVGLARCLVKR